MSPWSLKLSYRFLLSKWDWHMKDQLLLNCQVVTGGPCMHACTACCNFQFLCVISPLHSLWDLQFIHGASPVIHHAHLDTTLQRRHNSKTTVIKTSIVAARFLLCVLFDGWREAADGQRKENFSFWWCVWSCNQDQHFWFCLQLFYPFNGCVYAGNKTDTNGLKRLKTVASAPSIFQFRHWKEERLEHKGVRPPDNKATEGGDHSSSCYTALAKPSPVDLLIRRHHPHVLPLCLLSVASQNTGVTSVIWRRKEENAPPHRSH